MLLKLFLLFTVVPLVELSLLIKVGKAIGVMETVALVLITGIVGAYLAREQGLRVVREFQDSINRGDMPTHALIEGLLIVVGGVLLVTPGIITDFIGFTLVIPPTRKFIREYMERHLETKIQVGMQTPGSSAFYYSSSIRESHKTDKRHDDDDIIDV